MNEFFKYIVEKILPKLLLPGQGESLKVYFKGLALAIIACAFVFWLFFFNDVQQYRSFGQKLGTFKVKKDGQTDIAAEDLVIVFRELSYKHDDSIPFPFFELTSLSSRRSMFCRPCEIGQRMYINSKCCDYKVVFVKLAISERDTVAYLDVYRKYITDN